MLLHVLHVLQIIIFVKGGTIIRSEAGVQQGDPLGPLLFAILLFPLSQIIDSNLSSPAKLRSWYLDDGHYVASYAQCCKIISIIKRFGPRDGMSLNSIKCLMWTPNSLCDWNVRGLLYAKSLDSEAKETFFPLPLPSLRAGGGILSLGGGLGQEIPAVDAIVRERFDKVIKVLKALPPLHDKVIQYVLFRHCLSLPKVMYVLRTTPAWKFPTSFKLLEDQMKEIIVNLFGDHPNIRHDHIIRFGFSSSSAGFSAPLLSQAHQSAYLASRIQSLPHQVQILGGPGISVEQFLEFNPRFKDSLEHLITQFNDNFPTEGKLSVNRVSLEVLLLIHHLQTALTSRLHKVWIFNHRSGLRSKMEIANFETALLDHSGAWLDIFPSSRAGTYMTSSQFMVALSVRMGLPVHKEGVPCQRCNRYGAFADTMGIHDMTCHGAAMTRHEAVKETFIELLSRTRGFLRGSGIIFRVEERDLIPDSNLIPADIFLPCGIRGSAQPLAIDLTVANSYDDCESSASTIRRWSADRETPRKWISSDPIDSAVFTKNQKYLAGLNAQNITFQVFAMGSIGGYNSDAIALMRYIGDRLCDAESRECSESTSYVYARMSWTLQRAQANAILQNGHVNGNICFFGNAI